MPLFNGPELRAFIDQADYVVVNDYESNLLQERTGWDERRSSAGSRPTSPPVARRVRSSTPGKELRHPAGARAPRGRPDRLWRRLPRRLIYGIQKGYDWPTIGRMGNLMGALKAEHPGTQNQRFTFDEFESKATHGYAKLNVNCSRIPPIPRFGAPLEQQGGFPPDALLGMLAGGVDLGRHTV